MVRRRNINQSLQKVEEVVVESAGLCGAYQSLHNSVIGGIHVGVEGEGAFSLAVVRCITLWCYDPVLIRVEQQAGIG